MKNLLSNDDQTSHKRFIAIISFFMLIVLSLLSAYGHRVEDSFVYVFASLTGGESFLTVIEKFRK